MKIDYYYEEGDAGYFTPIIRNIDIENIECNKSQFAMWIRVIRRSPVTDIPFRTCTFNNTAEPNIIENVKDLSLVNVKINGK